MIYSKHHSTTPEKSTSVLIAAGAGTEKSDWIKANLLQMDENFIVVDPGGEYAKTVGNVLKENGYKVQILNLKDPQKGVHYNPFTYDFEDSRVQNLVDAILKNVKNEKDDGYFYNAERTLLSSVMAYVLEFGKEQKWDNVRDFIQLVETLTEPEKENGFFRLMEHASEDSIAKRYFDSFQEYVGEKTQKSVLVASVVDMQDLFTEDMLDCMKQDDLCLDQWSEEKTALFLVTHPMEKKNNVVLSIFFCQLFSLLSKESQKWKYPVHCIMDEFMNCGIIPDLDDAISYHGDRFHLSLILQETEHMVERYNGMSNQYLNSFEDCLFLGVTDDASISYFAKRFNLPKESLKQLKKNHCILQQSDWKNPVIDKKYKYKKHPAYKKTADHKPTQIFDLEA